jgi:hypothetical protein
MCQQCSELAIPITALHMRGHKHTAGILQHAQNRLVLCDRLLTLAIAWAAAMRTSHGIVSTACCSCETTAIIAGFSLACSAITCGKMLF